MDISVSSQGEATELTGESLTIFTMFETLMDMGVSAQGVDMVLRGEYLAIFIRLRHLWTWVCQTKGQILTYKGNPL